jgi:hypothetical protein
MPRQEPAAGLRREAQERCALCNLNDVLMLELGHVGRSGWKQSGSGGFTAAPKKARHEADFALL